MSLPVHRVIHRSEPPSGLVEKDVVVLLTRYPLDVQGHSQLTQPRAALEEDEGASVGYLGGGGQGGR